MKNGWKRPTVNDPITTSNLLKAIGKEWKKFQGFPVSENLEPKSYQVRPKSMWKMSDLGFQIPQNLPKMA